MGLAKRTDMQYRYPESREVRFDPSGLAGKMKANLPDVEFAYLLGSASDGVVPPCADLDLAVYLKSGIKPGWDRLNNIMQVAEDSVGCSVDVDVGILNTAGCVFRFEALKGRQLFVRPDNMEEFIRFFSMTCREYEDYMYRIERYHRYREELEQPAA